MLAKLRCELEDVGANAEYFVLFQLILALDHLLSLPLRLDPLIVL